MLRQDKDHDDWEHDGKPKANHANDEIEIKNMQKKRNKKKEKKKMKMKNKKKKKKKKKKKMMMMMKHDNSSCCKNARVLYLWHAQQYLSHSCLVSM